MKNYIYILAILVSACSLEPDYQRPKINDLAEDFDNSDPELANKDKIDAEWWNNFGNNELTKTIESALANNKDIEASLQRIEQARANVTIAGASLFPSVTASASSNRSYNYLLENNSSNKFTAAGRASNAQIDISYEVDLWGKNRASRNSAEERYKASTYDHQALMLVVEAETAQAYSTLLSLNDRIRFAQANLINARKVLEIVQARFDTGINSALEVAQQKTTVSNFEISLSSLKQQKSATLTQLAVLTGKVPEKASFTGNSLTELKLPAIKTYQPADIISNRPDIASSEAALKAANIDIGVARAALFPNLQLSLNSAFNSLTSPDTLATSLIASTALPIFKAGSIQANIEYSQARKKELAASYYSTVLNSLKEIEDAYSALEAARQKVKSNIVAVENAKLANNISLDKFKSGIIDFQPLLDTQRSLIQAQDSLVQARLDQFLNSITLFKALGGGWQGPKE